MQKHLLTLEKCPKDNARQYIVVRERKLAFSVYLMHVDSEGVQALKLLTKIKRSTLKFHDQGQRESGDLDSFSELLKEHVREEFSYLTEMKIRQKRLSHKEAAERWREKKKGETTEK